jgi:long-chain acyl-CoA synthetase
MLQLVLAHPDRATYDLSSLQRIFYGAAPMTKPLLRAAMAALPDTGFVQGYGMTETALTVMLPPWYYTAEGQKQGKISSIGYALPLTEVAVRDGWLYTGDGAYTDADGFVHLVDRIKDMIITGAENVYSTEVETVLAGHPAVAMCAVIGIPHQSWGEQVHAIVTLKPGATATTDELVAHCRTQLSGYKCPRGVEFRDALPVSAAGKILKTSLRAEYANQGDRQSPAGSH